MNVSEWYKKHIGVIKMRIYILAILLVFGLSAKAAERILVTVNHNAITEYDLKKRAGFLRETGIKIDLSDKETQKEILNTLIEEQLLIKELTTRGIKFGKAELTSYAQAVKDTRLFKYLTSKDFKDTDPYIQYNLGKLAVTTIIQTDIRNFTNISDDEISSEMKLLVRMEPTSVRALILADEQTKLDQIKSDLSKALVSVKGCDDFEKILQSKNLTSLILKPKELHKNLQAYINQLSEGRPSETIVENGKLYLFMVCSIKSSESNVSKDQVREALLNKKIAAKIQTYLDGLKRRALIEYK